MNKKIDLSKKINDLSQNIPKHTHSIKPPYEYNNNASSNEYDSQSIDDENSSYQEYENETETTETYNNYVNETHQGYDNSSSKINYMVMLKNPVIRKIILFSIPVVIILLLMAYVVSAISTGSGGNSLGFKGFYTTRCKEMTVIFVDENNKYEVTGSKTYSMKDYVAGVVSTEVGELKNLELYKTLAIAARTYGLKYASDDCTIESSTRTQEFKDVTNNQSETVSMIYEAVEAVEGKILASGGEPYEIEYDEFCYVEKDADYYTLAQQEQQIPTNWVESNISSYTHKNCPCNLNDESMKQCWSENTWEDGGTGRGFSLYGAYYLAKEVGYTYDEILEYYYGDNNVTISSSSFLLSIAGQEIKDTTRASDLMQPIDDFLNERGSSLEELNNYIHDTVVDTGPGTREGVIAAAVSLINFLYDNFNTKLPYYWGGKVWSTKIPSSFGVYTQSSLTRGGGYNYYRSFDCSGFVSWAIMAGGYNFQGASTSGFDTLFSSNSCEVSESSCIGQPGDLINSREGHVELILAVDEENGEYFIAHSGGPGVVMMKRGLHTGNGSNTVNKILFMEGFYNNQSNVNQDY